MRQLGAALRGCLHQRVALDVLQHRQSGRRDDGFLRVGMAGHQRRALFA